MQRIERYGVIALVLLLVTIAAVSFWEDEANAAKPKSDELAKATHQRTLNTPRDADRLLPDTANPSQAARAREQKARDARRNRQLAQAAQAQKAERERVALEQEQSAAKQNGPEDLPFPNSLSGEKGSANAKLQPNRNRQNERMQDERDLVAKEEGRKRKMQITPPKNDKPKDAAKAGFHVVKKGENLGEIAYTTLGTSKRWREIAALNGGSDKIYEGQKLILPSTDGGALEVVQAKASKPKNNTTGKKPLNVSTSGNIHVVARGDMLSMIAQDKLGSAKRWREIAALNPSVNPDRLLEGTRLVMPKSRAGSDNRVALASTTPQPKKKRRVR